MRDPLFDLFDKVFDRETKKPDRAGWDTTNINSRTDDGSSGEDGGGNGSGGGPGAGQTGGGNKGPKKKGIRLPKFPGKGALIALAAVLIYGTVGSCYYVLDEDNYAVVTTLGSPQAISQAGLQSPRRDCTSSCRWSRESPRSPRSSRACPSAISPRQTRPSARKLS